MIEFNATFLIAMLSFVVFIIIMNAIFYKPVLNIIRKREEYIDSLYEDSKHSIESAKQIEQERKEKILEHQKKCRNEFTKAVDKFQADANFQIKTAKARQKEIIREGKAKLLQDKENLERELQDSIVENLATSITSKILRNNQLRVK